MVKLIITCGIFLFICSASISHAANGEPCVTEKTTSKKQACKTSEKLIPEKLLKIKPVELKNADKSVSPSGQSVKAPSAANTFETLITPLLKAVSPHFYDQIIKNEPKVSSKRS